MTTGDIVNWPPEVEFKALDDLNTEELKKVHDVARDDLLDFAPEFISRLETKKPSQSKVLKSDFTKYLADKLAKELNVDSIKVPWSEMTAKDIINWPENVEFKRPNVLKKNDLKTLHKMAKEDLLNFSPEFIRRFTIEKKGLNELKSDFTKHLADKLAKKLDVGRIKIPWSEMTAKDIINWPPEVKFQRPYFMDKNDFKRLDEVARKGLLDFSPEFFESKRVNQNFRI
jgi:hypothetical protein